MAKFSSLPLMLLLVYAGLVESQGRRQRCSRRGPRCGIFNVGYLIHLGESGTEGCFQFCSYFGTLKDGLTCGKCGEVITPPSPAPTASPTSSPTIGDCSGTPCVFGLGSAMHRGLQDTTSCEEVCTFNPDVRDGFRCGYCLSSGSEEPTPSPTGAPTAAPSTSMVPSLMPTITAVPVNPSQYNIALELVGVPTVDASAFSTAAARWESVITGDLPSVSGAEFDGKPPIGCSFPRLVDDLYICGKFEKFDGQNNAAAAARPLFLRGNAATGLSFPVYSEIIIDEEDAPFAKEAGLLDALVTHEMGHALGFGSAWVTHGLANPTTGGGCEYTGGFATAEYKSLTGCDMVPLDVTGDAGTQCLHWSEDCFGNELMTGELDFGQNPLSRVTIASLEDFGYEVDYDGAEPFSPLCPCQDERNLSDFHGNVRKLTSESPTATLSDELRQQAIEIGNEILRKSSRTSSVDGRISKKDDHVTYVGDMLVSVIMRQEDSYYGVLVVNEDLLEVRRA